MDERRLDGNAVGGLIGEVFAFEATTAEGACDNCGTVAHVGQQMAYVSEIGTVVRCVSCDNVLIRIAKNLHRPAGRHLRGLHEARRVAPPTEPGPARRPLLLTNQKK